MEEKKIEEILMNTSEQYCFPENPFESIGFTLSGGGFRAACYGLGSLSVLNELKLEDDTRVLDKVSFVSSASGGTITLLTYTASVRKGMSFREYFCHLNSKLTGEMLLIKAMEILKDPAAWEVGGKARNLINSFAKVYHSSIFDFLSEQERDLQFIMEPEIKRKPSHVKEFCFNASEFYTGLSFRFQGAEKEWQPRGGGKFGNSNIGINWKNRAEAGKTLKQLRFGDILASSSCFPLGFEPIMFPRDFTYSGGPTVSALKQAVQMKTYSWGNKASDEVSNRLSQRAADERNFADAGEFGLMDGGICDNQGLYSLLEANKRKDGRISSQKPYNRFELMVVSDVASFYMKPYKEPSVAENGWNKKTPQDYWDSLMSYKASVSKWLSVAVYATALITLGGLLLLFLEGLSIAAVLLTVVGAVLFSIVSYCRIKYKKFFRSRPKLKAAFDKENLQELYRNYFPEDNFTNRTATEMISHLQSVPARELLIMLASRGHSAVTMVSDVFLKHIRRLIYDQLFENQSYKYRRLDNPIYRLSHTNNKNRRMPEFDNQDEEDKAAYEARKKIFQKDVASSCSLNKELQDLAEVAYNAPTTLWFTPQEELSGKQNLRKAIIATGQFSTCYSLLQYTLSLRHSRNFSSLSSKSQERIELLLGQLRLMMKNFNENPFYLYNELTDENA